MEFIGDIFTSLLAGGATGLLGLAGNIWSEYKKQKEANRHKEEMARIDKETMEAEANLAIQKVEVEGQIATTIEATKALAESYKHDTATYFKGEQGAIAKFFFGIVDFFRGMLRPGITIFFVGMTTYVFIEILNIVNGFQGALTAPEAVDILKRIIIMILYLTSTCVTWWFGGRQMEKADARLRESL